MHLQNDLYMTSFYIDMDYGQTFLFDELINIHFPFRQFSTKKKTENHRYFHQFFFCFLSYRMIVIYFV